MNGNSDKGNSKVKGKKRSTSQRSPTDIREHKKKLKMSGEKEKKEKEKKKSPAKLPKDDASVCEWAKHILAEIKTSEKRTADKIDQLDTNISSYKKDHAEQMKQFTKVNSCVAKLIHENTYLKDQCNELQEKLVKLEYHSRRNKDSKKRKVKQTGIATIRSDAPWQIVMKMRWIQIIQKTS